MKLKSLILVLCSFCAVSLHAQWTTSGNNIYNSNSGNVGIGITSPTYKLHLVGNALLGNSLGTGIYVGTSTQAVFSRTGGKLALYTNGSDRLTVQSDGTVGIGTTTPSQLLQIKKDQSAYTYLIVDNAGTVASGTGAGIGLAESNTIVAALRSERDGTGAVNLINGGNGPIYFRTGSTLAAATTKMAILNNGKVGIGTISPLNSFSVIDNINVSGGPPNGTTPTQGFLLGAYSTTGVLNMGVDATGVFYSWLQSRDNASAVYYNLALNPFGGNVGIRTTSPLFPLQVSTTVNANQMILGSSVGVAFGVVKADEGYGLHFGIAGAGYSWIQSGRTNTATAYNLVLQSAGGNVGIGTTSPTAKLHVFTSGAENAQTWGNNNTANTSIYDYNASPNSPSIVFGDGTGWKFHIAKKSDNGFTKFLTIQDNNGYVGIGTSSPNKPLHVLKSTPNGEGGWIKVQNEVYSTGTGATMGISFHTIDQRYALIQGIGQDEYGQINRLAIGLTDHINDTYFERVSILHDGSVGIGTTTPGSYKLNVAGKIRADEIVVNTTGADFVFEHNYNLPELNEVEKFISEKGHLP